MWDSVLIATYIFLLSISFLGLGYSLSWIIGSMGNGRTRGVSLGPTSSMAFKSTPRQFTEIETYDEANMEDYQNVDARLSILELKMANMLSILEQNGFMHANCVIAAHTNGDSPYCIYKNPGRVCNMRVQPTSTQVFRSISHRNIRNEAHIDQNVDTRLSILETQMTKVVSILQRNGLMQGNI